MRRTLMRLAPSHAGGRLLSGIAIGGGRSSTFGTGVPSLFVNSGPFNLSVTVPQLAGGRPARGVIVQHVTRPRVKRKPPTAKRMPATMRMICVMEGRRNLISLRNVILFIQVLYIPYPVRAGPSL